MAGQSLFGWDLAAPGAAAGEIDAASRGTYIMHNAPDGVAPTWLQQPFIDFKCLYGVSDRLFVKAAMDRCRIPQMLVYAPPLIFPNQEL